MKFIKIIPALLFFAICVPLAWAQDKVDPAIVKDIFDSLSSERKVENLKLGEPSPNELEGYQFFKSGRLKDLKLGISTRENVKEILGKDCEARCEYSDDWRIVFTYFDHITKEITEDGQKVKYVADQKFAHALYSITFVPKKSISFSSVVFSDQFRKSPIVSFGHGLSGEVMHVASFGYFDAYGLMYTVFDKVTFSNTGEKGSRESGDLLAVVYSIPTQLEKNMFVKEK